MTRKFHVLFSMAFGIVVAIAIAWGVMLAGSPGQARLQRFDQQRLNDLQTIFREIQSLCRDPDIKDRLKRPLPASLAELADVARSERINVADPETGKEYEYRVTGENAYELCAVFALERKSDVHVFWNHTAGRTCFAINALDPP